MDIEAIEIDKSTADIIKELKKTGFKTKNEEQQRNNFTEDLKNIEGIKKILNR